SLNAFAGSSETWFDYLQHLSSACRFLTSRNGIAKSEKGSFARPAVKYLDYTTESGKLAPDPEKLKTVESLTASATQRTPTPVLGLCNCYPELIANFANIASPLTNFTSKVVSGQ